MRAHSSAQFERFRLLAAGDIQGPPEAGFRLLLLRPRLPQEQDAPEARDFCFAPAGLMLLHQGVGLSQRLEAVFRVAQRITHCRQRDETAWDKRPCPGSLRGGDPLAYLGHPRLALALHS